MYVIVLTYSQVVKKDLMDMLVRELKEELEARSESKTDNKAWLRRRLHGAIVRAHLLDAKHSAHVSTVHVSTVERAA